MFIKSIFKEVSKSMKSKTSTYTVEFELITTFQDRYIINKKIPRDMGKRFFFKLIRFLCKHSGFCLFKYEVYMQPNSKYIENNYDNSKGNLNQNTDE